MQLENSLNKLISFVEKEKFIGYDPYDVLNSFIPFNKLGDYISAFAIQIQKRNPVNIRPLLGVRKGINPKGMGLFLKGYCLLFMKTGDEKYLKKAEEIFQWLVNNYSKGFSGMCWGYNFDWASPGSYLKAYTPSVVVTSFVIDGIYEYYKITKSDEASNAILSAAKYIEKDIPVTQLEHGKCFAYTHLSKGCCYNATLLAAEVLAKANDIAKNELYEMLIKDVVTLVLSRQKHNGSWFYSLNTQTNTERNQIDFHQGFILVSLYNILNISQVLKSEIEEAIRGGMEFYRKEQFFENGRSMWRLPKKWPVDIHNQSQGIITFSLLQNYGADYKDFSLKIAEWTINNLYSGKGYFYYRMTPIFTNKISYIRWSQAWMFLALAQILKNE